MSQTLTYVIGSDRRPHVDNIQDFKVDFSDDNHNWVQARQFERGMRQVFVNVVNEDGQPFDLTGCIVWFEGFLPKTSKGDFRVIDKDGYVPLDPSAGKFRFDMPGQAFTVAGSYRQAFFRIVKNGNSVTTLEFDLDVLADKVIDGLVPKDWIGPFEEIADKLVDSLQKHTDDAGKIIADFQQKVTDLINQLNQQGSTTTSMLTELQNRIGALETKIKQDGLFTQAEADAFKQEIQELCNDWIDDVKNARGGYGTLGEKEIAQDNNINAAQKTADQAVNQNVTQDAAIQINKDDIANIRENLPSYAKASDVAIMQSRMDTYTHLANGSTSGDAELADLRIGADGVTYGNAGDAVRTQFNVQRQLVETATRLSNRYDIDTGTFVKGNINNTNGKTENTITDGSEYRSDFIPVTKPSIRILAIKGGAVAIYAYDRARHFIGWYGAYWGYETWEGYENMAYVRISVKAQDNSGKNLIPGGKITQDVLNGIKLYNFNENATTINLKEVGAQADGVYDDSYVLSEAIKSAKKHAGTVYIPAGKYLLKNTIEEIANINVIGDWAASDYHSGTVLLDGRASQATDFLLTVSGKFSISGFSVLGNSQMHNGVRFHNGGWDSYVNNVIVMQFYRNGVLFDSGAEDIHVNGLFINHCGSQTHLDNGDYKFGLELTNRTNVIMFTNCHVEHCRLLIGLHGAYSCSFVNCHIEQSAAGVDQDIPFSPIDNIGSSDILFSNNLLTGINKAAYTNAKMTPRYFIDISRATSSPKQFVNSSFVNNAFVAGMGSGDASSTGIKSTQFLKVSGPSRVVVNGNKFTNASQDNGIVLGDRSIFSNNAVVYAVDAGDIVLTGHNSVITSNVFDLQDCHKMDTAGSKVANNAYFDTDGKEIEV